MVEKIYGHQLSGIFDYSHLTGDYPGDQAEYRRVPNADLTCVKAPISMAPQRFLVLQMLLPLRGTVADSLKWVKET